MTKPEKSQRQKLFEEIRHIVATKHQVPTHLTEWELNFILSVLKNEEKK